MDSPGSDYVKRYMSIIISKKNSIWNRMESINIAFCDILRKILAWKKTKKRITSLYIFCIPNKRIGYREKVRGRKKRDVRERVGFEKWTIGLLQWYRYWQGCSLSQGFLPYKLLRQKLCWNKFFLYVDGCFLTFGGLMRKLFLLLCLTFLCTPQFMLL